ncbi:MAG: hypothetical protein EOO51_07045 [Flavobacterium sp.]|nr:MAG: hypothetical protein EOO51_07045 [Flavobacterium sp.]
MLRRKINLEDVLVKSRRRDKSHDRLLAGVYKLLAENEAERRAIRNKLIESGRAENNLLRLDLLEKDKIFHLSHIRKICVDYRLRFLDASQFRAGIPEEAITKIHRLEKDHNTQLSGFKIAAPAKSFKLMNYDDPLLFVPIGNEYFYLVHKWGNDLDANRRWLVLPIKNLLNFTIACVVLSLIITLMIPETKLSKSVPMASVIIFLFAFKSVLAVAMYGFFMGGRKLSTGSWDSPYYNN